MLCIVNGWVDNFTEDPEYQIIKDGLRAILLLACDKNQNATTWPSQKPWSGPRDFLTFPTVLAVDQVKKIFLALVFVNEYIYLPAMFGFYSHGIRYTQEVQLEGGDAAAIDFKNLDVLESFSIVSQQPMSPPTLVLEVTHVKQGQLLFPYYKTFANTTTSTYVNFYDAPLNNCAQQFRLKSTAPCRVHVTGIMLNAGHRQSDLMTLDELVRIGFRVHVK